MKKMIRKISAMTVATMLMFGMGTSAFADSTIGANKVGADGSRVTFTDTFTISEDDHARNLPAATFNYSIGSAGVSAMAASETSPKINVGVGSPTISNAVHAATTAGDTEDSVDVTADFSGVSFSEAGIYRYAIREELGASNVAEDIAIDTANDEAGTFWLDVYVEKEGSGFRPFAYILTTSAEAPSLSDSDNDNANDTATYAHKIDSITNEYTTYDLTISKKIEGAMAANDFAFTINLTNIPEDAYIAQDSAEAAAGTASGNSFSATLGNGESTVIYGLPSSAAYAIREAVSQTEGYSVAVEDDNANAGEYGWIDANSFGSAAANTIGKADTNVGFTTTLMTISPTGVVMRFAPYMLILGAGIALVIVSRRRKIQQD